MKTETLPNIFTFKHHMTILNDLLKVILIYLLVKKIMLCNHLIVIHIETLT